MCHRLRPRIYASLLWLVVEKVSVGVWPCEFVNVVSDIVTEREREKWLKNK